MSVYKRICLCGSMTVFPRMKEVRDILESRDIAIEMPSLNEPTDYSSMPESERAPHKNEMIRRHLARIRNSDAILVVNEDAKGIKGYIGANSFLEMGFAFVLEKPILLLNEIPNQPNRDEILGLNPRVLKGDLGSI